MKDSKKLLGERLKAAREKMGLKQNRVALSLGIHNSTLAKYESGEREVDLDTLNKLAEIYEVKVDYLITGRTYAPSPSEKKDKPDPLSNTFFREWDKADEDKKKRTLDFIRFLNQQDDEGTNK
ncbi:helix-turn-helix domain-containing protein [Brevibacillus reuszeri]|uniref:helix-turn-helix domain-containing protein n=1 Tax=Brevibacillus reuszeri TaxID=54915 RepID=UPI000CCC1409|nr:helix-turn-helix transcriptional regulator [Brevibacillus reuszeri]